MKKRMKNYRRDGFLLAAPFFAATAAGIRSRFVSMEQITRSVLDLDSFRRNEFPKSVNAFTLFKNAHYLSPLTPFLTLQGRTHGQSNRHCK
jgi:hypothetical protein